MEKIKLSLTDFVDISLRSGLRKITNIKYIKKRDEYSPVTDFYKQLREHIIEIHEEGVSKNSLFPANKLTTNIRKVSNYDILLKGYKKF